MTPSSKVIPALLIPFIAWRVYRRVRRNVGRQPLHPTKLKVSTGIFVAITLIFAAVAYQHLPVLAALAGGIVLSAGIAWYGLRLTRFECSPAGNFYTPNTALGIAISTLFIGRIIYRTLVLSTGIQLNGAVPPAPFQSPLTYFLFGLTAGYYICYQTGVLLRGRAPAGGS